MNETNKSEKMKIPTIFQKLGYNLRGYIQKNVPIIYSINTDMPKVLKNIVINIDENLSTWANNHTIASFVESLDRLAEEEQIAMESSKKVPLKALNVMKKIVKTSDVNSTNLADEILEAFKKPEIEEDLKTAAKNREPVIMYENSGRMVDRVSPLV